MKLSIKSLWSKSGKVDKAFALFLFVYLLSLVAWPDTGFEGIVAFVTFCLGAWIALRLLRIGLRKLTWRLRNRLIVAYAFIAVLPILLVLTLVGLGAYMLAGQVAVYLVRSELDRRLVSLRSVAEHATDSPSDIRVIDATRAATFSWIDFVDVAEWSEPGVAARRGREFARDAAREFEWVRFARRTLLRLGGRRGG